VRCWEVMTYGSRFDGLREAGTMGREGGRKGGREGGANAKWKTYPFREGREGGREGVPACVAKNETNVLGERRHFPVGECLKAGLDAP